MRLAGLLLVVLLWTTIATAGPIYTLDTLELGDGAASVTVGLVVDDGVRGELGAIWGVDDLLIQEATGDIIYNARLPQDDQHFVEGHYNPTSGDFLLEGAGYSTTEAIGPGNTRGLRLTPSDVRYQAPTDETIWLKRSVTGRTSAAFPVGDSNLDLVFDSLDLVEIFQKAKYDRDLPASWSEGDWTGDGRFDSTDLVIAFQFGDYEPIPEPAVAGVFCSVVFFLALRRRRSMQ